MFKLPPNIPLIAFTRLKMFSYVEQSVIPSSICSDEFNCIYLSDATRNFDNLIPGVFLPTYAATK